MTRRDDYWTPGWPPHSTTATLARWWVWGDLHGERRPAMYLVAWAPDGAALIVYFQRGADAALTLAPRPGAYVYHQRADVPVPNGLPWPPPLREQPREEP